MGIFKDFATSGFGTFTQGVLDEADNIAMQDARTNAIVAENSLRKENEAFALTELAFKNKDQLVKNVIDNADELNIIPGELTVEQIADRLVSKVFNTQRSIFEQKDYDSVSNAFAKFLAKTPGEEIILKNPYIPSEDLFNQEAEKHSARISAITKMPKADKLLHNIKKAEEGVESPEAIFNKAMTEGAEAREAIALQDAEREEKRKIAGEEDFMAAGGGIAGIRRPNAIPPESGP